MIIDKDKYAEGDVLGVMRDLADAGHHVSLCGPHGPQITYWLLFLHGMRGGDVNGVVMLDTNGSPWPMILRAIDHANKEQESRRERRG